MSYSSLTCRLKLWNRQNCKHWKYFWNVILSQEKKSVKCEKLNYKQECYLVCGFAARLCVLIFAGLLITQLIFLKYFKRSCFYWVDNIVMCHVVIICFKNLLIGTCFHDANQEVERTSPPISVFCCKHCGQKTVLPPLSPLFSGLQQQGHGQTPLFHSKVQLAPIHGVPLQYRSCPLPNFHL